MNKPKAMDCSIDILVSAAEAAVSSLLKRNKKQECRKKLRQAFENIEQTQQINQK